MRLEFLLQLLEYDTSQIFIHHTHDKQKHHASNAEQGLFSPSYWTSRETWKRAAVNTTRCLIGCTSGDFSTMWLLQRYIPGLGMGMIVPISSKSMKITLDEKGI